MVRTLRRPAEFNIHQRADVEAFFFFHPFIFHVNLFKAIKINYSPPSPRSLESKVNVYNALITTVPGIRDSLCWSHGANLILHERGRVIAGALQA